MANTDTTYKSAEELEKELENLKYQLSEANDTIDAIRTGKVDALVVHNNDGHQLYTLKSADQTYRVFIEKMNEGAVTLNSKGIVLYSNTQFASLVNLPLSKVIGMHFYEFIADESIISFNDIFIRCWLADCKGEVYISSGLNKKCVQLSLTTLELDEGTSLSVIITDLTTQKATQEELKNNYHQLEAINKALESSNQDLLQFASVASHDLQEPLRKIQVFSTLLAQKKEDLIPDSQKYLDKIIESSARMKTLIVDILNYSKLSTNQINLEWTDLNDIVHELREDFELMIKDKNAKLHVDKLPALEVNKGQIRQVFQNILSNALKFSKVSVEPEIRISCRMIEKRSFDSPFNINGNFAFIKITDNGIGFDEKYLENIFALFERLHSKGKFEGTGIGLAIAKKIVEKHNGMITARSKEGEGSEFSIILPVQQQF